MDTFPAQLGGVVEEGAAELALGEKWGSETPHLLTGEVNLDFLASPFLKT